MLKSSGGSPGFAADVSAFGLSSSEACLPVAPPMRGAEDGAGGTSGIGALAWGDVFTRGTFGAVSGLGSGFASTLGAGELFRIAIIARADGLTCRAPPAGGGIDPRPGDVDGRAGDPGGVDVAGFWNRASSFAHEMH